MTIQEATKSALDECRNNDFFKKVDMHKLIRELYPQPFPTIIGISFTQVNRKCSKVYDDIMEKYKEIPEDKRPDKTAIGRIKVFLFIKVPHYVKRSKSYYIECLGNRFP